MTMLDQYCSLGFNGSSINLEEGSQEGGYFCTPLGMNVIGWENGIHYGTIEGCGELIFAVNPDSAVDSHAYPLAQNFEDFLRLILACGTTTAIEQIVWMSRERFEDFVKQDPRPRGNEDSLRRLQTELKLQPMEQPYDYVKALQESFDSSKLQYSNEYYDTLGIPRPDGSELEEQGWDFEDVYVYVRRDEEC